MMEEQALCRIHRLGQRKEVRTVRFMMEDSFEKVFCPASYIFSHTCTNSFFWKVVAIQADKRDIAALAFSDDERRQAVDGTNRLQVGRLLPQPTFFCKTNLGDYRQSKQQSNGTRRMQSSERPRWT